MAKYHVNSTTGNVGLCSAGEGKCPFGGSDQHYATRGEAQKAYESSQKQTPEPLSKFSPALLKRAEKYQESEIWHQLPKQATGELIKNAAAWGKVHGRGYVAVSYEEVKLWKDIESQLSDYSDEGEGHYPVAEKRIGIATADGEYIELIFQSSLDVYHDEYWRFHPELNVNYSYYENAKAYENGELSATNDFNLDDEEATIKSLRSTDRYGSSAPNYDWGSSASAKVAAEKLLIDSSMNPYTISRRVILADGQKKIPANVLTGASYLGSSDEKVRAAVAVYPSLPKTAHERLLADSSPRVRASLAWRDDLSKETMEQLLTMRDFPEGDSWLKPRAVMLGNAKLPVRLINKAIKEGTVEDLRSLNRNTGLTSKAREMLSARVRALGIRV